MKREGGVCMKKCIWIVSLFVLANCSRYKKSEPLSLGEFCSMFKNKVTTADDVIKYFPKTEKEVAEYGAHAIARAQQDLDKVLMCAPEKRTFDNTARAIDIIIGQFSSIKDTMFVLEMVSPIEAIRKACHKEVLKLNAFAVDTFASKKVYQAFKDYAHGNAVHEKLNDEQRYFIDETMRDFKRQGLSLPDDQYEEIQKIRKELTALLMTFEENIATDKSMIKVTLNDLAGCDDHFVRSLECDTTGHCVIGCDYPTYYEVMENCSVEETRKRLYMAFGNRAYPANMEVLNAIIAKRDTLAQKLGFESYAALDLDSVMAKTPQRAEQFIYELATRAHIKMDQELAIFKKNLPEGVSLDEQGRFKPWDLAYVKNNYKKKHFNIDQHRIAEYFPVEQTLQGVFDIYQRFLNLKFTLLKPSWSWNDEVRLIEVRQKHDNRLRGYVFIDLYPRADKYSHACHCGMLQTSKTYKQDGSIEYSPSAAIVIANFPRGTKERPALLKHLDVETFFHEFGHAMHFVLGSTEMISFAGTAVKTDFVEVPSQIFEEWMFDKQLLMGLSKHYKTGEPLPENLINTMIELKKFDSGWFVVRQCMLSLVSLEFYKQGATKDTSAITRMLAEKLTPEVRFVPDVHMQASFGHLTEYGAKYYSYMWAKVYALDLFYVLKDQGLVNPQAGKVFVDKILAKGGSVDPNLLLHDYLGREPNQDAFFKDLGILA